MQVDKLNYQCVDHSIRCQVIGHSVIMDFLRVTLSKVKNNKELLYMIAFISFSGRPCLLLQSPQCIVAENNVTDMLVVRPPVTFNCDKVFYTAEHSFGRDWCCWDRQILSSQLRHDGKDCNVLSPPIQRIYFDILTLRTLEISVEFISWYCCVLQVNKPLHRPC